MRKKVKAYEKYQFQLVKKYKIKIKICKIRSIMKIIIKKMITNKIKKKKLQQKIQRKNNSQISKINLLVNNNKRKRVDHLRLKNQKVTAEVKVLQKINKNQYLTRL